MEQRPSHGCMKYSHSTHSSGPSYGCMEHSQAAAGPSPWLCAQVLSTAEQLADNAALAAEVEALKATKAGLEAELAHRCVHDCMCACVCVCVSCVHVCRLFVYVCLFRAVCLTYRVYLYYVMSVSVYVSCNCCVLCTGSSKRLARCRRGEDGLTLGLLCRDLAGLLGARNGVAGLVWWCVAGACSGSLRMISKSLSKRRDLLIVALL